MKPVFRQKVVAGDQGTVTVAGLPLREGDVVEVTVVKEDGQATMHDVRDRLRGTVVKYDGPFAPAAPPEDWDALQ
jgi:hypothetical protein